MSKFFILTLSDVLPGELVEYPGVHTAKHDLVPLGGLPQPGHSIQHPEQPHGHHLMTVRSVPGHHQSLVTIIMVTIIMVYHHGHCHHCQYHGHSHHYHSHYNHLGHFHGHGDQGLTLARYWAHLIIQLEDPSSLVPGKPRS